MRQKLSFIVISGMTTRYNRASEDDVHSQDVFETMIHFLKNVAPLQGERHGSAVLMVFMP